MKTLLLVTIIALFGFAGSAHASLYPSPPSNFVQYPAYHQQPLVIYRNPVVQRRAYVNYSPSLYYSDAPYANYTQTHGHIQRASRRAYIQRASTRSTIQKAERGGYIQRSYSGGYIQPAQRYTYIQQAVR